MITVIKKDDSEEVALYEFLVRTHVKSQADLFLFNLWWAEQAKKKHETKNDERTGR